MPFQDMPALQMGLRSRTSAWPDALSGELVVFEVEDFFGMIAMEPANHFRFGLRAKQVDVRPRRIGDFGVRDFINLFFVHDGPAFIPVFAGAPRSKWHSVAFTR